MNKKLYFFFLVTLFLSSNFKLVFAQTKTDEILLTEAISQIEKKFEVLFSYADKNLESTYVLTPDYNKSIKNIIDNLEQQVNLKFIQIDANTFAVKTVDELIEIEKIQKLQEVIITSYLTKGISVNDDGSTKLKPKSFGILPGLIEPDILHAIQTLPGIQSVNEKISNLNVRGGTNDQNLILWEGVKMYQTGHFFGLISAFNPYAIDNVTLFKNGTSAMFGDGISSVIDMKKSNNINKKKSGAGLNLIDADAFTNLKISNDIGLQLAVRRSSTDIFTTPTYNQYLKRVFENSAVVNRSATSVSTNENFYFYDLSAKITFDITDKDKLSFSALNMSNKLNYDEKNNSASQIKTHENGLNQESLALTLDYYKTWNKQFYTAVKVYLSSYKINAFDKNVLNKQMLNQENKVLDLGLKLHGFYKFSDNVNYVGGYQFSEIEVTNQEFVNTPQFERYTRTILRTHAIFNEIRYTSNSGKTIFKVGIRNNYFPKFAEFNVEPRVSLNQKLSEDYRLEILGEIKSQTTSQIIDLQNDFLGIENRRWILANKNDVPITESGQISVGLHYNKNKLLISAETYFKEVRNVTSRSQAFQNQFQFINTTGKYVVKGIDFLINKQFKNLNTWFSYSFSDNNYTFESLNNNQTFQHNLNIKHAATLATTYTQKKWQLGLSLNWKTGKPYTTISSSQAQNNIIDYQEPNALNLPNYFRIDASAKYNFKIGMKLRSSLGISLWNITNRSNVLNRYYVIDETETVREVENQSLAFTPNFSLRVDF